MTTAYQSLDSLKNWWREYIRPRLHRATSRLKVFGERYIPGGPNPGLGVYRVLLTAFIQVFFVILPMVYLIPIVFTPEGVPGMIAHQLAHMCREAGGPCDFKALLGGYALGVIISINMITLFLRSLAYMVDADVHEEISQDVHSHLDLIEAKVEALKTLIMAIRREAKDKEAAEAVEETAAQPEPKHPLVSRSYVIAMVISAVVFAAWAWPYIFRQP